MDASFLINTPHFRNLKKLDSGPSPLIAEVGQFSHLQWASICLANVTSADLATVRENFFQTTDPSKYFNLRYRACPGIEELAETLGEEGQLFDQCIVWHYKLQNMPEHVLSVTYAETAFEYKILKAEDVRQEAVIVDWHGDN